VEFAYKGDKIDEKYNALGIFYCRHRYSFLIFLLFLLSFQSIPSCYRMEILPFRAKVLSFLSLLGAGSHVCRRIPVFQFPFPIEGINRFKRGKMALLSILRK